jgi:hypothetical protein
MSESPVFSKSKIPDANDAQALADWKTGDDPLRVVLPLSIAASWAYSSKDTFDEVMRRRGLRGGESTFVQMANDAMFVCARAYIQPVGSGAILAFRGTEPTDLINWIADASIRKVAFHSQPAGAVRGYVHGGFYRNVRAIWPQIIETLHALDPSWLFITGHSFGAAVAALAGALLADYGEERPTGYGVLWSRLKGVFTFGQPMVGDETFVTRYRPLLGDRLFRFVYGHDIVTHLPPKTEGWTPKHLGNQYVASEDSTWAVDKTSLRPAGVVADNIIALTAWVKEQVGFAPKLIPPYSWADHAPNNYVRVSLPQGADSGSEFD